MDGPDLFGSSADPEPEDLPSDAVLEALEASRDPAPDPAAMQRPEAPLALYRRYRPDIFADVIGQEHVTEPLQRALTNNRVNHAYLFSGPRGCGKTTSARILARALNCEKGPSPVPCGECQSCRDLARGGFGSIDVIEIDAASHGGVDDARDLRERAFFAPVSSRYKIYIVDEAHMVTTAGFNALLKLVEEPPPHVKFIFATTEPDKVIGTIRSRTHHYPFRLVPPKTLTAYLGTLCEAEGCRWTRPRCPWWCAPAPARCGIRSRCSISCSAVPATTGSPMPGGRPARLHPRHPARRVRGRLRRGRCGRGLRLRRQGDRGGSGPAPVRRRPAAPIARPDHRGRGAGRAQLRSGRRRRRSG